MNTLRSVLIPLLLAVFVFAACVAACGPPSNTSTSGDSATNAASSAEGELAVELAFQVAATSSVIAKQAAASAQDVVGCLSLASAEGAIHTAHNAWRGVLELQHTDHQLHLPPTTVDARVCAALGLPTPEVDVDVDGQVRLVLGALDGSMTAVAEFVCLDRGHTHARCLELQAAAGALDAGADIYAAVIAALQDEADDADGLVMVDLPPIPIPREGRALVPAGDHEISDDAGFYDTGRRQDE